MISIKLRKEGVKNIVFSVLSRSSISKICIFDFGMISIKFKRRGVKYHFLGFYQEVQFQFYQFSISVS